jgi:hypothetical protein
VGGEVVDVLMLQRGHCGLYCQSSYDSSMTGELMLSDRQMCRLRDSSVAMRAGESPEVKFSTSTIGCGLNVLTSHSSG